MNKSINAFMKGMSDREYARNMVGPLMMGLGIFLLVFMRSSTQTAGASQIVIFTLSGILVASGIVVTYIGVIRDSLERLPADFR